MNVIDKPLADAGGFFVPGDAAAWWLHGIKTNKKGLRLSL